MSIQFSGLKLSHCLSAVSSSGLALFMLASGCGAMDMSADLDRDPIKNQSEELSAPANWSQMNTSTAPTYLYITANISSDSGTTNDIKLQYRNNSGNYSCTITDTISNGATKGCVPSKSSNDKSAKGADEFYYGYVNSTNSDGLLVTTIGFTMEGASYYVSTFNKGNTVPSPFSCTGCSGIWSEDSCNSCWIDGDGHNNCTRIRTFLESPAYSWCD